MLRPVLVLLTLLTMVMGLRESRVGAATPATPVAGMAPSRCVREPRSVDEIRALAGVRERAVVISTLEDLPRELPSGVPVDAAAASAIRAMLDEFAACVLSGDQLRGFAYFSDRFIHDAGPLDESYLASLVATPTPEPDQTFYSIADVSRIETLADGRVGAVVTASGGCERSQPEPTCTFYTIFVQERGRWSFDEQIRELAAPDGSHVLTVPEYLEQHGTPAATPAA